MLKSILGVKSRNIEVMDRRLGKTFSETVYSKNAMQVLYGNPLGLQVTSRLLTATWLNAIYGAYHDSSVSRRKIGPFIEELGIDLAECEKTSDQYPCFNDFFARKLKKGARPLAKNRHAVVSPADGRLLVFPRLEDSTLSYLKWAPIKLLELFGNDKKKARRYRKGACVIVRLSPADYHRFHFPIGGVAGPTRTVAGRLHSVSPYALEQRIPVYCLNKRMITEIKSESAGTVTFMEVGALLVGGIVQTFEPGQRVGRGEEKGYFKFGGSTVITFFEEDSIDFDSDLIENSKNQIETLVRMGEQIAMLRV